MFGQGFVRFGKRVARWCYFLGAVTGSLLAFSDVAEAYLPSIKIGTAALISPGSADSYYTSFSQPNKSTDGLAQITGVAAPTPPEIVELARALKNDPDLIYQYVRNNIQTIWMYGLQKGALGAEIDKSGTAFDQAELLVALMQQAGFTARYFAGTIQFDTPAEIQQFISWTGISNARAACQLLANGGIPGAINGTANADCSAISSGASLTSVQMAHIWVQVTIPGSHSAGCNASDKCLFDPSLKVYSWKTGINLAAAMGFTPGTLMSDAKTGSFTSGSKGTGGTVPFANALNASQLNTDLQGYATNLLSYIQSNNLQGAQLEDIISGGILVPDNSTVRQSALPYIDPSPPYTIHTWETTLPRFNAIPDHYRATLTVEATTKQYSGGQPTVDVEMFNPTQFFADEIYGRRLTVETDFTTLGIGTSQPNYYKQNTCLAIDAQNTHGSTPWPLSQCLVNYAYTPPSGLMARTLPVMLKLTADHPYAASASGGTSATGDYMDAEADKPVGLITPLTIVHSWGDVSPVLFGKWSEERASDDAQPVLNVAPLCPGGGGTLHETCAPIYAKPTGNFAREKTSAGWLAQFSRAARINAALANAVPQLHHTLGVVFADADLSGTSISPYSPPGMTLGDNFDRIDVDAGISFTSKTTSTAAANARRGALMAFAGSSAALEGNMAAQIADLPDTSSTATRFEWGNSPDPDHSTGGQNPFSLGSQDFYQYDSTTYTQAATLTAVDDAKLGSCSGTGIDVWSAAPTLTDAQCHGSTGTPVLGLTGWVADWISRYAQGGFKVVASREAFLGPGQRGGMIFPSGVSGGVPTQYTHLIGHQRGGALVALKLDGNGDPTEIAHIIVDGNSGTKGGGGGTQPDAKTSYDPSTAADILKSRFVDRSGLLGVNLSNGSLGATSPMSISVGNGGFPYGLSASLSWHPGTPNPGFSPVSPISPEPGWINSWKNKLTLSGSGMEAMGQSDIRGAIGAIVAFYGAQDIYQSTQLPEREAAAVLVQAWWMHQLSGNVMTVNVGGDARQFIKIVTGAWIQPGAGYATAAMTNSRAPFQDKCFHVQTDNTPYALSRGWDASNVLFAVTNAQGDTENFGYFDNGFYTDQQRVCGHLRGFRLTSWTFPQGMTITPTYAPITVGDDQLDAIAHVDNNIGRGLVFTSTAISAGTRSITLADGSTLPAWMKDALNNQTSYTYQAAQAVSTTQRPVPYALLASVTTPEHPSQHNTDYSYDALGRIDQVYDATAIQSGTRGPYNFFLADGTRGERDDPLGQTYSVVYDTYGHPSRYIDEMGIAIGAVVDSRGRAVQHVYPEGDCEVFKYDNRNNTTDFWKVDKTSSCDIAAGSSHVLHSSASWDAVWNKPLTVTNARGYFTTLTYYGSGNGKSLVYQVTRPTITEGSPVYTLTYDAKGKVVDATGPTGIVSHNVYDTSENLTSSVQDYGTGHLNLTTAYAYDTDANVQSTTDARGNVTTSLYDADRRKTEDDHHDGNAAAALNAASKTVFDQIGRVTDEQAGTAFSGTTVTTWLTTRHTTYTPTSKVATITDADSRTTSTSYDQGDRTLTVSDPIGRNAHFDYCQYGDPTCAANAVKTEYRAWESGTACSLASPSLQECYRRVTYGLDGEQASLKDANGNVTNYTYDGFSRAYQTIFPDGTTETIPLSGGYDENGNVLQRTNRAGQTLTYQYNALDWTTQKVSPSPAVTTTWTYLLDGRIDTLVDNAGTGNTIDYGYDGAGRMTQVATKIPGISNKTVNYVLDANGNRTKLTWPGSPSYYVGYCYDTLNRMTAAMENSTSPGCATSLLAAYQYDALLRRTNLTYAGTGAQVQYTSYSSAGDLLTLINDLSGTSNDNTYTYGYTYAHQTNRVDATNAAWLWQPPSNNATSYTVNNLNQYTTSGGTSFTYDGKGNLTNDGTYTFAYDAENRLLTACKPVSCASPTVNVTYSYDPLGRRTKKTGTGVTETYYLSDGADEIAEYDTSSNLINRYIPGPGIDQSIAQITGTGVKTFFHTDKQGSVIAMSDTAGALVEGPYIYDAYGNCTSGGSTCTISAATSPYRFTGRRWDAETGCYYYRARYYCPDDKRGGRFLQTDLIGYMADLNLYAYAGNDPTNHGDPTGESAYVNVTNGTDVSIIIPVLVGGDASAADVTRVTGNIASVWTNTFGKYHVVTTVQVLTPAEAGKVRFYNRLYVINGPTARNGGHSFIEKIPGLPRAGGDIWITMQDVNSSGARGGEAAKGPNTPAHECGHCQGLADKPGVNIGGIMDDSHGIDITEQDIADIIASPENVVTVDGRPVDGSSDGKPPSIQNSPVTSSSGVCSKKKGGCGPGGGVEGVWGNGGPN